MMKWAFVSTNPTGELKKAINLTPFSQDPNFNGTWDEFTTGTKKTVDDRGLPVQHNADDIIFDGLEISNQENEHASARLGSEKRVHVSVFQRESADKYSAQGGTTSPTCSAGEKLASPPTRTLPEHFSLCDSERIKVLSLNCMDDLSSDSKVVHRALCRNWNGATVKTNTATIVAFIRG